MIKSLRNVDYLGKIDRAYEQLENGLGRSHDLIEVAADE